MPETEKNLPTALEPFAFHGVDLAYREGDAEARGDCPFCGREGKFYVNAEDGRWNCRVCSEHGNVHSFMGWYWEACSQAGEKLDRFAEEKRLPRYALDLWGVRVSPLLGDLVLPGYDAAGKVNQLYRWVWNPVESRWYWRLAKGTNHRMHGVNLFDRERSRVYVCEGLGDAVALRHTLAAWREVDGVFVPAEDGGESLLADANVIAVPTCTTFAEQWTPLFAGKDVYLMFDNDHPDKMGRCAGTEGAKHVVNVMVVADDPPASIHRLKWGEADHDPDLPHRYDIRDLLAFPPEEVSGTYEDEVSSRLHFMFERIEPVPADWVEGAKKKGKPLVEPLPCKSWDELVKVCEKALHFHEGMFRGLAVMMAAASSVDIGADQLWVKFIGPPSSGKTTLAEGLLIARKYATSISILTGLHSGYKGPESEGDKDFSVMARVKGKAAIIKDGDTLLQTENRAKTLSDLRDAYDRFTSTNYKNGINREYRDHAFVLLLFGTSSLRLLDNSEMGQRMLDCVIMDGVDEKVEAKVIEAKRHRIRLIMSNQSTANGEKTEGKDLVLAKRMVAGYLIHLRENIKYLIEKVDPTEKSLIEIEGLAKFVAIFRARPSTVQTEEQSRELGARLFDQLAKLAYCLCVVMNKTKFDKDVMDIVRKTALDTCRGKTLNIARTLYKAGPQGKSKNDLGILVNMGSNEITPLLTFLKAIDIMEPFAKQGKVGLGAGSNRWRLTKSAFDLYGKVLKHS